MIKMFKVNEQLTISVTRGDMGTLAVTADKDGELYTFQTNDLVRFQVFEKKDCTNVLLSKEIRVAEATQQVEVLLTGKDTRLGKPISKPEDYWYEVELNPLTAPQTIIGYDENGPKIFRLFPEGGEM